MQSHRIEGTDQIVEALGNPGVAVSARGIVPRGTPKNWGCLQSHSRLRSWSILVGRTFQALASREMAPIPLSVTLHTSNNAARLHSVRARKTESCAGFFSLHCNLALIASIPSNANHGTKSVLYRGP